MATTPPAGSKVRALEDAVYALAETDVGFQALAFAGITAAHRDVLRAAVDRARRRADALAAAERETTP
jgi:hypothetical protein